MVNPELRYLAHKQARYINDFTMVSTIVKQAQEILGNDVFLAAEYQRCVKMYTSLREEHKSKGNTVCRGSDTK